MLPGGGGSWGFWNFQTWGVTQNGGDCFEMGEGDLTPLRHMCSVCEHPEDHETQCFPFSQFMETQY